MDTAAARILGVCCSTQSTEILRALCCSEGYHLNVFSQYRDALHALESEDYDLLVVNVSEDAGATSRFRQRAPEAALIVLSAEPTEEVIAEGLRNSARDYLREPCSRAAMSRSVANALRFKTLEDQNVEYRKNVHQTLEGLTSQLLHADRLATVGTFVAEVAHEVKNHMLPVLVASQMLEGMWNNHHGAAQRGAALSVEEKRKQELAMAEVPRIISSMKSGIKLIQNMMGELSEYAGRRNRDEDECDVESCLQEAHRVAGFKTKGGVKVDFRLPGDLPVLKVSPERLQQVLVNLLVNACDAISSQGENGRILVAAEQREGIVRIVVEDNGPGLSDECLAHMWEPFYTTKSSGNGTGLGLSISRRVVGSMGGTLLGENASEDGARFTIALPVGGEHGKTCLGD